MNERKIGTLSIVSVIFGGLSLLFGIASIIFGFITAGICMMFGTISIITGIIALVKKNKIAMPIIGIGMSIISFFMAVIIVIVSIISLVTSYTRNIEIDNDGDYSYYSNSSINKNNSKNKDKISGYSYIEKQDNSLLDLKSDGTFLYYKDKDDKTDNYYEGTYVVYQGEDAIEYIADDLEMYGLTEVEQRELIRRNDKEENYYCLVLKNEKCIMDGKNTLTSTIETPYYGFFFERINTLRIVNMKSANIYNFVR